MTFEHSFVQYFTLILLVSLRFLGMTVAAPSFAPPSYPVPVKFMFALVLSLALSPLLEYPQGLFQGSFIALILVGLREFCIGLGIGFFASLPLYAFQLAGGFSGINMGFGMVNILDPFSETQVSLLGQLKFMLALWFYFKWDGHILLFRCLVHSFKLLPFGIWGWSWSNGSITGEWLVELFYLAIKISLPFLGAMLLADIGLGFVARTVPQMNVFVLGFSIKILLGMLVLMFMVPLLVDILKVEIEKAVALALEGVYLWR